MNLSTFLFRSSVFIITIALLLSALAIEASLFWRVFFYAVHVVLLSLMEYVLSVRSAGPFK
jgi:hypothetical protein